MKTKEFDPIIHKVKIQMYIHSSQVILVYKFQKNKFPRLNHTLLIVFFSFNPGLMDLLTGNT